MKKLALISAVLLTSVISTALIAKEVVITNKAPNDTYQWTSENPSVKFPITNDTRQPLNVEVYAQKQIPNPQPMQPPIQLTGVNIQCGSVQHHLDAGAGVFVCGIEPSDTMTISNDGVNPKLSSQGTATIR